MRGNKGITLIALVITIIVLLILAGISISMLVGDNSILVNASKTPDYNKIATAKDQVSIKVQEYVLSYLMALYKNDGSYIGESSTTDALGAVNEAIEFVKNNKSELRN